MNLFAGTDYKAFLRGIVSDKQRGGAPSQAALARAAGCQPAYLSQVLRGDHEISLEQALGIGQYLEFNAEETRYLLLLVQYARADTASLKSVFKSEIREAQGRQKRLKYRLEKSREIGPEALAIYFSQWHYAAVHLSTGLASVRNKQDLCRLLEIGEAAADEAIQFLETHGLIIRDGAFYSAGKARFHLPDDSPHISSHHANWRIKAITHLKNREGETLERDLHYSSVVTLSQEDAAEIRSRLLDEIEKHKKRIKESSPEKMYSFLVDFFAIG